MEIENKISERIREVVKTLPEDKRKDANAIQEALKNDMIYQELIKQLK